MFRLQVRYYLDMCYHSAFVLLLVWSHNNVLMWLWEKKFRMVDTWFRKLARHVTGKLKNMGHLLFQKNFQDLAVSVVRSSDRQWSTVWSQGSNILSHLLNFPILHSFAFKFKLVNYSILWPIMSEPDWYNLLCILDFITWLFHFDLLAV